MAKHNHKCSCDHSDVKFCKCCQTVYCTNCNQEWTTKSPSYWYQYPYTYTTTAGQYNGNLGGITTGATWTQDTTKTHTHTLDNQLNDGHKVELTSSTCTHKG